MKIIKYKKMGNGKYKVCLETYDLVLYEEVILKHNLLITKEIDTLLLDEINNENKFYEVYYSALDSIKARYRSVADVRTILVKKGFPIDLTEKAIDKLIYQGYLNDIFFIKFFINYQITAQNNGPYKIKKLLSQHQVNLDDVDKNLEVFSEEEQLQKINKLANRFYNSNKTKGGYVLKKKITADLLNYGYDIKLIEKVLNDYNFENNDKIAKKEYEKLYKKFSSKYSGCQLKKIINDKMYLKGLKYEENMPE